MSPSRTSSILRRGTERAATAEPSWRSRAGRLLGGAVALAVSACAADPARVPRTNLITGSTGGSWYAIGSAISERTNLAFDGHPITAVPGAGGVSNPARVARVPGDLAFSFLPFLRGAYRGERPYRQAHTELRHVATLVENKLHVLIADTLGITSLGDIRARELAVRIGTGPPGSGEEFLLREALTFYGISYDDIRRWGGRIDVLGTSERADAWRDYHADMLVFTINEPASIVTELLLTRPAHLWQVPADLSRALQETWGTTDARIAAEVYPRHDQPLATVGLSAVIFGTDDVSDEITYAMVRAIAESHEYLDTVHPAFRAWQPKEMIVNADVPYHRGAERYYRERQWIR